MSTATIDAVEVRRFLEIISRHATQLVNGATSPGLINLCRIDPLNGDKVLTSRFTVDDAKHMVEAALADAESFNVYVETRTVRPGLQAGARGGLEDTQCVFALVIDSDADKGKAGQINVRPSLIVQTSPGNFHHWFLFARAIPADQAKLIGDAMRAASGADADTGVPTQFYRVAGTPNFPNKAKQTRGRYTVEATRIVDQSGRLWTPEEMLAAFPPPASTSIPNPASTPGSATGQPDESTLPQDLLDDVRNGGIGRGNDKSRSGLFQSTVRKLKQRNWSVEDIVALFERHPHGVGAKYDGKRLAAEVKRSYDKVNGGPQPAPQPMPQPPPPPPQGPRAAPPPPPNPTPNPPPILSTIRLESGQLPYIVRETEQALLDADTEIYARAGSLVYPVFNEVVAASDGRKTTRAKLAAFTPDSLIELVAECAIFERYNIRKKDWTPVDPPAAADQDLAGTRTALAVPAGEWDHHHPDTALRRQPPVQSRLRPDIPALSSARAHAAADA